MGIEADNVVVRLRFETNEILYSAIKTKYYEHYAAISPCGIVLDSYGQDLKTIPDDY